MTSSTEPLSVCFMKYHSRQREGGGGDHGFLELKSLYAFLSHLLIHHLALAIPHHFFFYFSLPQIDPLMLQSWHDTHFVCIGEISKFNFKKPCAWGGLGGLTCRCVYVFEGLVHVCVLGREGGGSEPPG